MTSAGSSGGGAGAAVLAARLRGIRKRFGYRDVLRGIDLDLSRGACLAVHGPNGAGKSTLLRILSTQWKPTAGDVEVLGHDARKDPNRARAWVGIVSHESFLRRELTLEENLRFTCDLFGLGRERSASRIDDVLGKVGLAHRRGDLVATFSQGMAKRASVARSLLHEPEMWILDEPFSGLDASGREVLDGMIRGFRDRGGTVILVTHETSLAASLATESIRLEEGAITRRGPGAAALEPAESPGGRV